MPSINFNPLHVPFLLFTPSPTCLSTLPFFTPSETQLTIHNSEPTLHNGVYQCVVKSPLGVTYSVATLTVVEEGVVIEGDPQRVPYEHMQGTDPASHSNNGM